jgi:hypothetical protein
MKSGREDAATLAGLVPPVVVRQRTVRLGARRRFAVPWPEHVDRVMSRKIRARLVV